uniref:NAD(P)H-dependent oxidoreductase n=1 Tax=Polymorphobacter sp. TaxID=1909290 RepID=UPI003F712E88
ARGGFYAEAPAAAMEHAETHLRAMLGFIGIAEPEFIIAEGLAIGPEQREQAMTAAFDRAARIEPLALAA